jgi:ABC-type phosphate transport system substrate-binding protein
MSKPRNRYLVVIASVGALLLAGCGVSTKNAQQQGTVTTTTTSTTTTKKLPTRPSGTVAVDGTTQGSLSSAVAPLLAANNPPVRVNVGNSGANAAFQELCSGTIDVVDSARPIAPSEYSQCKANGIQVVQFQVASDAVVIATQNGYDVGVDCETLGQINAIFRRGSTIVNWAQVHGFNIPLRTTGPPPNGNGFDFFTQYALGSTAETLDPFRADYVAEPTEAQVRLNVVGREGDLKQALLKAKADRDYAALQAAITQKKAYIAQLEKQKKKIAPQFQGPINANLAKQKAGLAALERSVPAALAFKKSSDFAAARVNAAHQFAGIFRFSYYELYEEQLRPIEIETGTTTRHNCIFPSLTTVTNATYPLARQLLITVSTQALKRPEVQAFLRSYLNHAQALATNKRLVPLPDQIVVTELGWVSNPATAPRVYYAPGTRNPTNSAINLTPDSSIPAPPSSSSTIVTTGTTTTASATAASAPPASAPAVTTGGATTGTTTGSEATAPPYGSG